MNAWISWKFISINSKLNIIFYCLNEWKYQPINFTLSITTPLFVDFIGSLFISPFTFSLYHNQIRFFVVLFKIAADVFQMKNKQFSHSYYPLLHLLLNWKLFQQIHISLLSNILWSPLICTNNHFRYNKCSKMF